MTRGQGNEICNQIDNAFKELNLENEFLSNLIRDKFFFNQTKEILKKTINGSSPKTSFSKLTKDNFTCPATNGKYDRTDLTSFFTGYLSSNIEDYSANHDDIATLAIECHTQKLVKNATFLKMYDELIILVEDEAKIWWQSKSQIKAVMESNPDKFIKDGRCYFFFYKNQSGKRLVFSAYFNLGKWKLRLYEFEYTHVWDASNEHEVVLPQQVPVLLEK